MVQLMVGARRAAIVFGCVALSVLPASAQLLAAADGPIVYGHHHLNVASIDAHKKFWIDTLGGRAVTVGTSRTEIVMFPNVLIFLRQQPPTGGTKGTSVNHIAFAVTDVRRIRDRTRAAGYPIVTREEAGAGDVVTDDVSFNKEQGSYSMFVMGPDDIKVQFFEVKNSATPIALHHIHFAGPAPEMRDWYVREFGATPGVRGAYVTANLPGVDLSFGTATNVVGTRDRVLDHLGFEVKNLKGFCKKLEREGVTIVQPYTKVPALNIANAFIVDPWGTSIELTEGLDKVR